MTTPQPKNRRLRLDHVDFLSIFDQFDEGVLIVDHRGHIRFYNDAMSRIDDLDTDACLGKKVTEIYDLDDDTSMVMRCLASRMPILNQTFYYRTRVGKVANTIHSVFPLFQNGTLLGAICFVKDYRDIEATIASMAPPQARRRSRERTDYTFEDIIGNDPELKRCINTARMAANSPSPIMLYGETGTGKELFAQSIHHFSVRRDKPYIPVNCAAIPENLLEGILFGTTKGAFTGALDKAGLFQRANHGTLFLDEVNSMPVGLQAKILRVLQEKRVRRLGSLDEIAIDLKIISSVNRQPHRDIEKHRLRPDLFYRLGVVFIRIPPLKERKNDLLPLVHHFFNKIGSSHGIRARAIGNRVQKLFFDYPWPGNIRELEHIIEGALHMLHGADCIRMNHLPAYFKATTETGRRPSRWPAPHIDGAENLPGRHNQTGIDNGAAPLAVDFEAPLPETQAALEVDMLREALMRSYGNVTRAARQLGISRQLLHYKLKKHGIDRKDYVR